MDTVLSALGFLTVFVLPGYALGSLVGRRSSLGEALPALVRHFTWSLFILAVLSLFYFTRCLAFRSVVVLYYVMGGLGAVRVLVGLRGRRGFDFLRRGWTKLEKLLAGLLLFSLILVYLQKGRIDGDYTFHVAGVRKIASSSLFVPAMSWGRFDYAPFIGYRYPVLHFSLALAATISTQDPITISYYLPTYFFAVAVFIWYALARSVSGSESFSTAVAICFCLLKVLLLAARSVQMLLIPSIFSCQILLPLLLSLFFLLFHKNVKQPGFILLVLPVLVEVQLCIHASEWFFFWVVAAGFTLLSIAFRREKIRWACLLGTFALILVYAVPIAVSAAQSLPPGSLDDIFETEREFFRRYRWGMRHGLGRIECISWPDIYIVNRSLIFNSVTIPCFLYIFVVLHRRRFSKLNIYFITTVMSALLISLNPLALHTISRFFHFTTVYRVNWMLPTPLFMVAISIYLLDGLRAGKRLQRWFRSGPLQVKILSIFVLIVLIFLTYKYGWAPLRRNYFVLIKFYLMPIIALILIYGFVKVLVGVLRKKILLRSFAPPPTTMAHIGLILLFFSPLLILRVAGVSRSRVRLSPQPTGGKLGREAVCFIRHNIEPKSVFIANNRHISSLVPAYTDNYSYVGWRGSSPGFGMSAPARIKFVYRIFGELLDDRERYELLKEKGINYLLVSRTQLKPEIFESIMSSEHLRKIYGRGDRYIFQVLKTS